jgi:hypothetical protein
MPMPLLLSRAPTHRYVHFLFCKIDAFCSFLSIFNLLRVVVLFSFLADLQSHSSFPLPLPLPFCAQGHFDPNLACSEKSQSHSDNCALLNRTAATDYTYTCTAAAGGVTTYSNPTGNCEVGDLSGKFGKITLPSNKKATASAILTDFLPPYALNYDLNTAISTGWYSMVFHCGDQSGTRIACGDFQVTDGTTNKCNFDSSDWVQNEDCSAENADDDDDDYDGKISQSGLNILAAFFAIGWAAAIGLTVYIVACGKAAALSQQ